MTRTEFLRKATQESVHKGARIAMPTDWDTSAMDCSLPERKSYAIKKILDEMPLYIGECELIVGSRTIYGHQNEDVDKSDMSLSALPKYVNEADIQHFGFDGSNYTKTHYASGYERLLKIGIGDMISKVRDRITTEPLQQKKDYLNSIVIVYGALSDFIKRYSVYAHELAVKESDETRKQELLSIAQVCENIALGVPKNFWESTQLFWFSHLSLLVENFWFMNYGRVDQFLYKYCTDGDKELNQQLVDCLLLKMCDATDIKYSALGNVSGQHNITIGGVTRNGENAVNELSYMFIDGLSRTRFAEPETSVRINSKNPKDFLEKCAELSVSGLNCMAYYNDDVFIKSMVQVGIPQEDANDYSFDLCQDITIAGRGDFYVSGVVDFTLSVIDAMKKCTKTTTFDEYIELCKTELNTNIGNSIKDYNKVEKAVREYADGNQKYFFDELQAGNLVRGEKFALMSPLPFTSALFDGCIENARDISWFGCEIEDRGCMISNLVVGINSIASVRKYVFDEKKYSMAEVLKACDENFVGHEVLRQDMWNAPKWANDIDYVDLPAKELLESTCDEILTYRTPNGARHLAGIHQPHPVSTGEGLAATPEGRFKGMPVPVTLSPESGTMLNGPTAAFKSAAKIDPMKYQWNNCVMLQYFSTVFKSNDGAKLFSDMLLSYFAINGTQHQPNVVSFSDLKAAQENPEDYKDLVVRIWEVSAHFVDLPRDAQDEFMARLENI